MRIISYLFLLCIMLLGISFAVLNSETVVMNYYVGQHSFPLSFLLVSAFALGALLGILVGTWLLFKLKIKNYQLKQRLHLAEKEIDNLRAIPLQETHLQDAH